MSEWIFCDLPKGKFPSSIVYQDTSCTALRGGRGNGYAVRPLPQILSLWQSPGAVSRRDRQRSSCRAQILPHVSLREKIATE